MSSGVSGLVKFITQPSAHLLCPICKNVYNEPVINTLCGHTFCKNCAVISDAACPEDQSSIASDSLVPNRAVSAQVADLEIHCSHGLVYAEDVHEYLVDSQGCPAIIKLGGKEAHEGSCPYAMVPCPYNEEKCGRMRRNELEKHKTNCRNIPCHNKGCTFLGNHKELEHHAGECGKIMMNGSSSPAHGHPSYEMEQLVRQLLNRVTQLEMSKNGLEKQLLECKKNIHELQDTNKSLTTAIEKLQSSQNNVVQASHRLASISGRPSLSTQLSSTSRRPSLTSLNSVIKLDNDLWSMPLQFKCIGTLRGHNGTVFCLKQHQKQLFSCSDDKQIKVWDLDRVTAGCQHTIKDIGEKLVSMAAGSQYFYTGSTEGSLTSWNLQTFVLHKKVKDAHPGSRISVMITSKKHLFSAAAVSVKVWDMETLECLHTFSCGENTVRSLTLNREKDRLFIGSHNTIDIWATEEPFPLRGKVSHTYGGVQSLLVTGQFIFAGTENQNIHLFDAQSLEHKQKLSGHVGSINALTCSPAGNFLFSASSDKTIQIWHLEQNMMLRTQVLERHQASVTSLLLYQDLLLSASEDCEIKVFRRFKMLPGLPFTNVT